MKLTDRELLLQFIASLTLCDHMGDVADDISYVLQEIMPDLEEWDDYEELRELLGKEGVTTLYGTSLGDDDE